MYKNRTLHTLLCLAILLCLFTIPVSAIQSTPTASTVFVNDEIVPFDVYIINGNSYFKLRDLAYTLNGTPKQFSVSFDGSLHLTSGQAYTTVGGEIKGKSSSGKQVAEPINSKIIKNGVEVQFDAYIINGNNYFKLRDIGEAFDFGVDWDSARNAIVIDTSKDYVSDGIANNNASTTKMKRVEEDNITFNVPADWVRNANSSDIGYYADDTAFFMLGILDFSGSFNEELFEYWIDDMKDEIENFKEINKGTKNYGSGKNFYYLKYSGLVGSINVVSEVYLISWNGKLYLFTMADASGGYKYEEQMNNIISSVNFKTVDVVTPTPTPVQTVTPTPEKTTTTTSKSSREHYTTSYGPRGGAICWCGKYMSQH